MMNNETHLETTMETDISIFLPGLTIPFTTNHSIRPCLIFNSHCRSSCFVPVEVISLVKEYHQHHCRRQPSRDNQIGLHSHSLCSLFAHTFAVKTTQQEPICRGCRGEKSKGTLTENSVRLLSRLSLSAGVCFGDVTNLKVGKDCYFPHGVCHNQLVTYIHPQQLSLLPTFIFKCLHTMPASEGFHLQLLSVMAWLIAA